MAREYVLVDDSANEDFSIDPARCSNYTAVDVGLCTKVLLLELVVACVQPEIGNERDCQLLYFLCLGHVLL